MLPADSAALFQAWSGRGPVEDCGSFFAEKPQITLATGPDKASVGGSLPDKPRCSQQPQGPGSPRPFPEVSPPRDPRPSLPEAGTRPAPLSSGLRAQEKNTNTPIYFQEEAVKEWASPRGMPDCGSRGVVGGSGGGLESLLRAPQMTS